MSVLWIVLVGHLIPYNNKWWITVSDADGLESVVRKKKKKTRFILLKWLLNTLSAISMAQAPCRGKELTYEF